MIYTHRNFFDPIASIAVIPIFCLLRMISHAPFVREKQRKEAIRKGHVIEGSL